MEIERADMVSKRCKGNVVIKFMNLQSLTGIRNGIENGDIPEWLLREVLIRLSAKVVCRFKLVSKQWLSVISDSSFVRDYISRASLSSQPWTFISHLMHHECAQFSDFPEYVLLDHIDSQVFKSRYCVLPLPSTHQANGGDIYLISGVSSGLVLYHLRLQLGYVHSYYICNPLTGQSISIPPFTCHFRYGSCGFLTQVEYNVLKSYRVVRLDWFTGRSNFFKFEVFLSEIGEWKNFTVSSDIQKSISMQKEATTLNGILHWVASEVGIIAYDPYQSPERMRIIAFPGDIKRQRQGTSDSLCAACGGKLRYFQVSSMLISENLFPHFKLWVLNDYSSGDWCLQYKIDYHDVRYDTNLFFKSPVVPISFHPFDSDVVYLGYNDFLVSYNIKTSKLAVQQKCSSEKNCKRRPLWMWSFLLVTPPWPISISCSFSVATEG